MTKPHRIGEAKNINTQSPLARKAGCKKVMIIFIIYPWPPSTQGRKLLGSTRSTTVTTPAYPTFVGCCTVPLSSQIGVHVPLSLEIILVNETVNVVSVWIQLCSVKNIPLDLFLDLRRLHVAPILGHVDDLGL